MGFHEALITEYDLKTLPYRSHCSDVLRAVDKPRATMVWENNDTPARLDASSAAASPQEWDEAEMPVLLLTRELEVENLKDWG